MSDVNLLIVKPGTVSAMDRKMLRGAGVVVLELENTSDARFLAPTHEISGSEMLRAALKALGGNSLFTKDARDQFVFKLVESLKEPL